MTIFNDKKAAFAGVAEAPAWVELRQITLEFQSVIAGGSAEAWRLPELRRRYQAWSKRAAEIEQLMRALHTSHVLAKHG